MFVRLYMFKNQQCLNLFKILFRIIALNPSFASLLLQNIKVKTGKLETCQKLTETLSMPLYFDREMQTKKNVIFKSFKLCFWYNVRTTTFLF